MNKYSRIKHAHNIYKLLMQITFNNTATVIQQTWLTANYTDELLTFNSVL